MSNTAVQNAQSVYDEAQREAQRHKWIESQKHGRDLGDAALRDWYRLYWSAFCRYRHLEHLHGDRPWREFSPGIFGDLVPLTKMQDPLFDEILARVNDGQENLDIINWALECQLNMDRIRTILSALDVNRSRLKLAVA